MEYQYPVHNKVKFRREDIIRAGVNPSLVKFRSIITWFAYILCTIVISFMIFFPIGVAAYYKEYGFLAFYAILWTVLAGNVGILFFNQESNSTLTLGENQAHIEEDSILGKLFYKRTISYDNVCKVYHTEYCPFGLTPMAKNRKNPKYDKELWHFYNGSYIVAEDNKNGMFGAVYREEIWDFLKDHCKNAEFYTKEELEAETKKKRELDQKHDEYSKMYDGYIN